MIGGGAGCVILVVSYSTLACIHVNHFSHFMIFDHFKRLCAVVQVVVGSLILILLSLSSVAFQGWHISAERALQGCQVLPAGLVVGGASHPKYPHPPFCMEKQKPKVERVQLNIPEKHAIV